MLINSSYNCQSTNSLLLTLHFRKILLKKKKNLWYGARPVVFRSQGSGRYYTLKNSCLKLSNLWAFECPCGAQEILKVVGKLVRKKKKKKWHVPQWSEQRHCGSACSPLSRLAVTLLCTAGEVMQHEQQHLCVCYHCGTSSSPMSSRPPSVSQYALLTLWHF